jgi:hypothetical protein
MPSAASQYTRMANVVDANGLAIPTWPCKGASSASLFAMSASAPGSITVRLLAFVSVGTIGAISPQFTFTAGASADLGTYFSGTPNQATWMPIDGIGLIGIKIDAINGGPWTLGVTISRWRPKS